MWLARPGFTLPLGHRLQNGQGVIWWCRNIKTPSYLYVILHYKDKSIYDHIILIMEIPIPGKTFFALKQDPDGSAMSNKQKVSTLKMVFCNLQTPTWNRWRFFNATNEHDINKRFEKWTRREIQPWTMWWWTRRGPYLGLYSLSGKTFYGKISWSLEAARFGFRLFQSLWNLTGTSAAALPRCLSNFRTLRLL